MPKDYLPLKVDPFRFADNATCLHGKIPIKDMQRLGTSLYADDGEVIIDITFGVDEQRIRYLRGHIEATIVLQCQRCMESLNYEIINDFMSGFVQSEEEADALPERYDPVVVKDGILLIQDLIEDELILGLPIVPMHNLKDCKIAPPLAADSEMASEEKKDSPFKVIELLRSKRNTK